MSTDDGATWSNATANGNQTVSIWMNLYANYSGRQYRCKVTDANGNTQYSNPATLSLAMQEWQYEYNADGLRTKRTNGYSTYEYVYLNGQLVRMLVDGNTLSFHYDADGKPMSFVYNGTTYYYTTNLQGDIVAILSKEGTQVVSYSYDAWGNILSITGTKADTIGKYNPLRYRGYVYDTESKLYYLQSRYYDANVGRFVNADAFASTGNGLLGHNMFAYCNNNPIFYTDPHGNEPVSLFFFGVAAIAVIVVTGLAVIHGTTINNHFSSEEENTFAVNNRGNVSSRKQDSKKKKPINIPSWKKMKVDLDHITSGHMPNGSRNPNDNKSVFVGMTVNQVLKAIREAYNHSSRVSSVGNRIKLSGYSSTYNLVVEIWVNIVTKTIETAYPKN